MLNQSQYRLQFSLWQASENTQLSEMHAGIVRSDPTEGSEAKAACLHETCVRNIPGGYYQAGESGLSIVASVRGEGIVWAAAL